MPGYNLMHGSRYAKAYVNDYLKYDLPIRLVDYRNGWQIDDVNLPTPEDFITHEPLAIDVWPTLITVVISTNKFDRIGYDSNDPIYRVSYQMRTYLWVRAEGNEGVTVMRDNLTTVLRAALLDYPCLKAFDSRTSFKAQIDEGSLSEEFSDVSLLKGDRAMAGAYLSFNLEIDEVVARKPIGTVGNIEVQFTSSGLNDALSSLDGTLNPLSASVNITG